MDITAKELVERVTQRATRLGEILASAEEFIVRVGESRAGHVEPISQPSYVDRVDVMERAACAAARAELKGAVYGISFDGFIGVERVGGRLWIEALAEGEYVEQVILLDD